MVELEALHRRHQFIAVMVIDSRRQVAEVAFTDQSPGQLGHPRILSPRTQQRPAGQWLPLWQGLLTLAGIDPTQVLIQLVLRARLFKSPGQVRPARAGKGQDAGLAVLCNLTGMPYRLEPRLLQATIVQVLQGLQILLADPDIGTQITSDRQFVGVGVQTVIRQLRKLPLQGAQTAIDRPYRLVILPLIKPLQHSQHRCIDPWRQDRTGLRQLAERLLYRACGVCL